MSKIASKSKLTLNADQKMSNPVGIRAASSYYDNFLRNIAKTDSRKNYWFFSHHFANNQSLFNFAITLNGTKFNEWRTKIYI